MTRQDLQAILQELYAIDPELKKHETALQQIITKFISARPEAELSTRFKDELRAELLSKAEELKRLPQEDARGMGWMRFLTAKNIAMTSLGAALVVVITVVALNQPTKKSSTTNLVGGNDSKKITQLSSRAFGELSAADLQPEGDSGLGASPSRESTDTAAPEATGTSGSSGSVVAAPDIAPVPSGGGTNYVYQYSGTISAPTTTLEVLKRLTGEGIKLDNTNLAESLGLDIVNLSTFPDTELQTITLIQNKAQGFSIDVNLSYGIVSAYEMSNVQDLKSEVQTWCAGPDCDNGSLSAADIPADETLIRMANEFLDEHGVDLTGYGEPEVQNQWGWFAAAELNAPFYISDTVQVLYPLVVNGKTVYQPGGDKTGLSVSIDIRQQRVTGFSNLAFQQYQSSPYETIQDVSQIESYIRRGGLYGYEVTDPDTTVTISLGEPSLQFIQLSKMDGNEYAEFLVPALVFEVVDQPATEITPQRHVVVPLIKDFFEEVPIPVPLLEPTAGDGSGTTPSDQIVPDSAEAQANQ